MGNSNRKIKVHRGPLNFARSPQTYTKYKVQISITWVNPFVWHADWAVTCSSPTGMGETRCMRHRNLAFLFLFMQDVCLSSNLCLCR
jgi:hypothetical protein